MNLMQEVLTTPGIVTQIANHLSNDNKDTLRSLYFLFNDSRYRYELQPFIEKMEEEKGKARETEKEDDREKASPS